MHQKNHKKITMTKLSTNSSLIYILLIAIVFSLHILLSVNSFVIIGNGRVYNQWTVVFACCCGNLTIFTEKIKGG